MPSSLTSSPATPLPLLRGIIGDGGAGSKRDITDGDDTNDRAYTAAEGQEDDGDHTSCPSQSSEHS